ncbi:hypothetical protein SK128_015829 [Halocaridina rubra]|uniref:Uncharacterized protein n=1 Tax=Halocaridina rubra TaxID=373956 RepID=A0AAN8ZZW8_HALRR
MVAWPTHTCLWLMVTESAFHICAFRLELVGFGQWRQISVRGDTINDVETGFHHLFSAVFETENVITLKHSCIVAGEVVVLSLLPSLPNAPTAVINDGTSCERKIVDILLRISQPLADIFDPRLNLGEPYYASIKQNASPWSIEFKKACTWEQDSKFIE